MDLLEDTVNCEINMDYVGYGSYIWEDDDEVDGKDIEVDNDDDNIYDDYDVDDHDKHDDDDEKIYW